MEDNAKQPQAKAGGTDAKGNAPVSASSRLQPATVLLQNYSVMAAPVATYTRGQNQVVVKRT